MAEHNDLGRRGEALANDFLEEKGYQILARNWRHKRSEIDLIARVGSFIVFVEVKTRSTAVFGEPEDFVSEKKQEMMINAAEIFFEQNTQEAGIEVRFDIISVIINPSGAIVQHFEDAFSDLP